MGHINPAVPHCMALPLVLSMSMDMPCTVNQVLCLLLLPSQCQRLHCTILSLSLQRLPQALLAASLLSCTCGCRQSKPAPVKTFYGSSQTVSQGTGNSTQPKGPQDAAIGQGVITRRRGAASQAASQQQASLRKPWHTMWLAAVGVHVCQGLPVGLGKHS